MKISYKCISCFFRQIDATTSLIKLNQKTKEKLFILLTKKLLKFDFNQPPVVFGRTIYQTISRVSGIKDIFLKEKIAIERYLLNFTPPIKHTIEEATNPLYTAAKMCCAGNAIDFGAGKTPDVKNLLRQIKNIRLKVDHFPIFREMIRKATKLLIIGDNCGEILFDKFFVKEVLRYNPKLKVFYATRSSPIINDVLISDAKRVGLHALAKVISSGCDYPGIIIPKSSLSFRNIYRGAEIIVSKGQGNFESLCDRRKHIFYLFQIKCLAVSEFLSLPVYSLIFLYNKSPLFPFNVNNFFY